LHHFTPHIDRFVSGEYARLTSDQFSEGLNQSGVAIVRSGTDSIFS